MTKAYLDLDSCIILIAHIWLTNLFKEGNKPNLTKYTRMYLSDMFNGL
jgi:hypothetical protein